MSFRYFYMMRILSILFVLILGISCTEKVEESKPLIEIYQLNKRIASYEGEPFKFTTERIKFDSIFYNQSKNIARTTDDNNLIINGDFRATSEDLNRTPLISNEQIKGYDFTTNELIVDEEACEYFTIIKK
nr:hypothetical protein [Nonlabens ulvanivorans]